MMKRCSRCGEEKLLEEFNRSASSPDGRYHYCRPCRATYQATYARGEQTALRAAMTASGLKRCPRCGQDMPLDQFPRSRSAPDGRGHYCTTCKSEYAAERYRADPAKVKRGVDSWKQRNADKWREIVPYHRAKKRIVTHEQYEAMLKEQGGACAICGQPQAQEGRMLCADHDHQTGQIRGLLCDVCNLGIGYFRDDPERCIQAARYLLRHAT